MSRWFNTGGPCKADSLEVLFDEIDLNLHPPVAQLLIRQLPKLCSTCQFIVTTHSDAVSDVIGEDDTYRLAGGSLCL